jgi:predicted RNase H-like HicB family nuclease
MKAKLPVICTKSDEGVYVAVCPDLEGCYTQADTYEKALSNIKELAEGIIKEDLDDEDRKFIVRSVERVYSEFEIAV